MVVHSDLKTVQGRQGIVSFYVLTFCHLTSFAQQIARPYGHDSIPTG